MTGRVSIPTEALADAPWRRERIQGYLDNDPTALALAMWAHAVAVDLYGLAPVAQMLAQLEGTAAAEVFTPRTDGNGVLLPLDTDAARGFAIMLASACLGILEAEGAENYVELDAFAPADAEAKWDEVTAPGPDGSRWAITVRRVDGRSPGQHAAELSDELLQWAASHQDRSRDADAIRRQADAALLKVALAEKRRRADQAAAVIR